MINLPLNFSAPTGQVQNTYTAPARINPYLTPSKYAGLQLHTPSGLYYQNGTMYEPFIYKDPKVGTIYNVFGAPIINNRTPSGESKDSTKDYLQINGQYFKPFTGNAEGVVNGNLSMVGMLGSQPTYQPQPLTDLFPSLNANLLQSQPTGDMYGAGRFLGLLGSPIVTTNTQGK